MNAMAKTILVLLIALTAVAAAQSARMSRIGETVLHGRRAVSLDNDRMLVSTLPGGGFIGEVRFQSSERFPILPPRPMPSWPMMTASNGGRGRGLRAGVGRKHGGVRASGGLGALAG